MNAVLRAAETAMWRMFAATITTGAAVWVIDRVFGRRP